MSDSGEAIKPEPAAKSETSGSPGVSFLVASVIALIFSGFGSMLTVWYMSQQIPKQAGVVVIDSKKIVEKRMKEVMAMPGMTAEKASEEGRKTVAGLDAALGEYRNQGLVVINSGVTLAWPANLDITKTVAARLNIRVE